MDNFNEVPTNGGMPNPNPNPNPTPKPSQPLNQPVSQPVFQQALQPVQTQPSTQPISSIPNNNNQGRKKNTNVIVGCSIGAVAAIALIAFLVITLLNQGGKTVTCTMNTTTMGIAIKGETNIKIRDGEISGGDMTVNVNLKTMRDSYKDYEEEIVDEMTESYKSNCEDHCKFDYNYVKGDNVKYTMQYDKEGISDIVWGYELEGMSAQEIADEVQESLEDSNTICTQN